MRHTQVFFLGHGDLKSVSPKILSENGTPKDLHKIVVVGDVPNGEKNIIDDLARDLGGVHVDIIGNDGSSGRCVMTEHGQGQQNILLVAPEGFYGAMQWALAGNLTRLFFF